MENALLINHLDTKIDQNIRMLHRKLFWNVWEAQIQHVLVDLE